MFGIGFAFKHEGKLIYPTMGMYVKICRNGRDWKTKYAFNIFDEIWKLEVCFQMYTQWYCRISALIDPNKFKLEEGSSRQKKIYVMCSLMVYELIFVKIGKITMPDVIPTNGRQLWAPNEFYEKFHQHNPEFWLRWKQKRMARCSQTCRKWSSTNNSGTNNNNKSSSNNNTSN